MKGDRIIIKFMIISYTLGILMFPLYYAFALTENPIYFIACLVLLGLMPVVFLKYDSKHLLLRLREREVLDMDLRLVDKDREEELK